MIKILNYVILKRIFMNYLFCILLIILGVGSRIIPHAPNFTPILSIALLSNLYIKNKFSILLPLSIMLISDILLGGNPMAHWVYVSIVLIILLGYFVRNTFKSIFLNSILSAFLFFVISNFGVWLNGGYSLTINGLLLCYYMALPFFKNTLISTLIFSSSIYYLFKYVDYFISNNKKLNLL